MSGSEIAGVVETDGGGLVAGERVVGLIEGGGFASHCVVHSSQLTRIPDTLSFRVAASLPISYGTALVGLKNRAQIKKGDVVLVTAAAGAVGLAAVDLAANVFGAKAVVAAASTDEKLAVAKSRGATHVINYKEKSGMEMT